MYNKGSFAPTARWLMGLTLIFVTVIVYAYFSAIIETTLPDTANNLGMGQNARQSMDWQILSWQYGILLFGLGGLLLILFGGIPGQQEEIQY